MVSSKLIMKTYLTKKEARLFLRKVMGPPHRTLFGLERSEVLCLLKLIDPFECTNNQHSITECYRVGDIEYHITLFGPNPDEDIVDEYLPEI